MNFDLICGGIVLFIATSAMAGPDIAPWIQAFEASPATYDNVSVALPSKLPPQYEFFRDSAPVNGTMRFRLAVTAGGAAVRIRISNELAKTPLHVGGASLGAAANDFDAAPGTVRRLTFGGRPDVTILPGAPMLSDPIPWKVEPLDDLVVSIFVDQPIPKPPFGGAVMERTDGDHVLDEKLSASTKIVSRPIVTGVLVAPPRPTRVLVAFGDSITDGARLEPSQPKGWADALARRLVKRGGAPIAVVSAGIGGNRVASGGGWGPVALARADRDVFAIPGVSHVILLEGINDIGGSGKTMLGDEPPLDLKTLVSAYAQIADRAHARGLRIYAGTLTPFRGCFYFSEDKEKLRVAANAWLRTSKLFDGVMDFERAVRDPAKPDQLQAAYDSGDHLHPSQAGYQAMADAVDLNLLD